MIENESYKIIGAFDRNDNKLCSYAVLKEHSEYVDFQMLKSKPSKEKYGVNAAVICYICELYKDKLSKEFYICDGERNVSHATLFQEYLEKYFEFRKAYCKIHISYNPKIKFIVQCLYLIRKILWKFDDIRMLHNVGVVVKMEEYIRESSNLERL